MKLNQLFVGLLMVFTCSTLWPHPTSFAGSTGIMGYHSPQLTHNQINYSWKHSFATGVHYYSKPNNTKKTANLLSANFLLKRWNGEKHQANLYAVLGLGKSSLNSDSIGVGLGLLQFDIEDRDYYFLAKYMELGNSKQTDLKQSTIRFGVTPYVDNYDGIHSWLILEWQETQFLGSTTLSELTPFLRIFYRNLLFEIGQTYDGNSKFNYITHF
ncbi:MAG: hypothetical protein AB8E15_13355 [Bdellovibrionales bacterium]